MLLLALLKIETNGAHYCKLVGLEHEAHFSYPGQTVSCDCRTEIELKKGK